MKSFKVSACFSNSPVQAKSMEKSRQPLHDQQNRYCQGSESSKYEEEEEASTQTPQFEADVDHHGPEHLRELCQEKGEKRAHVRTSARTEGCYILLTKHQCKLYKHKLKSSNLTTARRGTSEGRQHLQPSMSGHCLQPLQAAQGRALCIRSSLLYSASHSVPPSEQSTVPVFRPRYSQPTQAQLRPLPAALGSCAARSCVIPALRPPPAQGDQTQTHISDPQEHSRAWAKLSAQSLR